MVETNNEPQTPPTDELNQGKDANILYEEFKRSLIDGSFFLEAYKPIEEIGLERRWTRLKFLGFSIEEVERMSTEELQSEEKRAIEKVWAD